MKILKFGGSALLSKENISRLIQILNDSRENKTAVISAASGITDKLLDAATLAAKGNETYKNIYSEIRKFHLQLIKQVIETKKQTMVLSNVELLFDELKDTLYGIFLVKELTKRSSDKVASFGEIIASQIVFNLFEKCVFIDARDIIRTINSDSKTMVDFKETNQLILKKISQKDKLIIVPGFIASDSENITTTLGRGGSDFTASIIASAVDADSLEIWTDVDGFMTADPKMIKSAYSIETLSYIEALELSHFGAKVIYPPTIQPVYNKKIPVLIKNINNPLLKGTIITDTIDKIHYKQIKGISSINDISLITVQGLGMVGVSGIASRLFTVIANHQINVILISQASSENSISFAIHSSFAVTAQNAIHKEFEKEIKLKQINKVSCEDHLSIIAIVGENMKHTPGISGRMFNTLGIAGINIFAIAQGASETNISCVVKDDQVKKALHILHESFFLSEFAELNLFQVGAGNVGGSLLKQIANQQKKLLSEHKLKIKLIGVADIFKMYLNEDGIDIKKITETLDKSGEKSVVEDFVNKMIEMNLSNSVFIDCTASEKVSQFYKKILNANISVVTPNKIANSSQYKDYKELKNICNDKGVKFLYETNVGAGLPIIGTINDMIRSGDRIIRIEAVLSGTLNFIVNTISSKLPLSKVIKMAQEKGYSEPDPRIDLSGKDVARKLLILAREAGYPFEADDINLIPFIPEKYIKTKNLEEFFKIIDTLDAPFEKERKAIEDAGKIWRYVACLENGKATVSLTSVDRNSPLYNLEGSNNIILITTERYAEHPMIIKGYGAGAEVTAAGIFADIIKVSNI